MPRGTQSSQRKSKAMPQLTENRISFKVKKKKKQPTHSPTGFSYDTFLEQMAQRKLQTNFVICSNICHLHISIPLSLKDQQKVVISRPACRSRRWFKEKRKISTLNSFVLKREVISTLGSHQFWKVRKNTFSGKKLKRKKKCILMEYDKNNTA